MTTTPDPAQKDLLARIARLEQRLSETGRNPYFPFNVTNQSGNPMFRIAPSDWVDDDGSNIPAVNIYDKNGNLIFWQTAPSSHEDDSDPPRLVADSWEWAWLNGDVIAVASDGFSGRGLAKPYLSIPMYPRWAFSNQNAVPAAIDSNYATVVNSNIQTEKLMWVGELPYVSHPAFNIHGIWGRATGSGAEVTTYRVYFGNITPTQMLGTFDVAVGPLRSTHTYDLGPYMASEHALVFVTAQSNVSNTDWIACQVVGASLCGSPATFG